MHRIIIENERYKKLRREKERKKDKCKKNKNAEQVQSLLREYILAYI